MAGLGLVGVVGALVAMILQVEEHQHSHKSQQQEGHQNWMGKRNNSGKVFGVHTYTLGQKHRAQLCIVMAVSDHPRV